VALKKKTEADVLPSTDPWKTTALTGKDLVKASVEMDQQTGTPTVSLEFNENGKKLFSEITTRNVGKPVAIFLDNQPISIPTVNEAITDGKAVISGKFDILEAKTLSQRLNAGALPVPIKLISQQTVGASLGSDSLQKSLFAGFVGLILVMVFMILYYRLPGLLAAMSLIIYSIIVLFAFKAIPVTLTLSGIAGFVLSLGMAVDANVLVFERMKEELKLGKPLATAVSEGFRRAWTAIRDGNYTTLIVCLVLAWLGTGMIKGFAITLAIGVLTSMFSAMIITKYFMQLFVIGEKKEHNLWWYGAKNPKKETNK
jgi:preprotein translocase subunit SecD